MTNPTDRLPQNFSLIGDLSLRTKLVLIVMLLLVVALTISGSATVAVLRTQLLTQVDADLFNDSDSIIRRQAGGVTPDNSVRYPRHDWQAFSWKSSRDVDFSAPARFHSMSLRQESLSEPDLAQLRVKPPKLSDNDSGEFGSKGWNLELNELQGLTQTVSSKEPDGPNWRVLVRFDNCLLPQSGPRPGACAMVFSTPLDSVDGIADEMIRKLVILALTVLALCAAAGLFALRGAFAPLREVESVSAAFAAGDTSQRVVERPPHTEVGRLGGAINLMLEKIETTLAQREASEAKMRQFVADASHELRTPLVSVRGFAELYRQGAVQGEANISRAFSRIEDEARRMGGLVEDMLLLARLDEQRPMQFSQVNLTQIARDLVQDGYTLAPQRAFRLICADQALSGQELTEPHEDCDVYLTGDEARLRQVATNLVTNAIRHTPEGTAIDVAVHTDPSGGATFQVIDHGEGIPAEQAEKIFERFFRSDSSRQRQGGTGGSGLGLAIVSSIVHAHQGHVAVTETPGGGATFTVQFPNTLAVTDSDSQAPPS